MPRPTRSLISTITDKAISTFKGDPINDWPGWVTHWVKTAKDWKTELLSERLTTTAAAVQDHIEYTENLIKSRK